MFLLLLIYFADCKDVFHHSYPRQLGSLGLHRFFERSTVSIKPGLQLSKPASRLWNTYYE